MSPPPLQGVARRLLGHAVGADAASPSHLRRRRQQEAAAGAPQLPRDARTLQQTERVRAADLLESPVSAMGSFCSDTRMTGTALLCRSHSAEPGKALWGRS
jgi:hypothetical protein